MRSLEALRRLPKAELHVHLDGSLRPATLIDLAERAGVALPSSDPDTVRRFMAVRRVRDLEEYLARFTLTVAVLQTPDAVERVAWEMVQDAARDGVRYIEVRYCPTLSQTGGLSLDEVLAAEARGLARGTADFGVHAAIINCTLRHLPPEVSLELARASVAWRGRGVVGFDIAGGEARYPAAPHAEAFALARAGGLGITVHAGEAAGPESVREAIELCGAQRLGHGTRLIQDPALMAAVAAQGIAIEACLSSNAQTRAVERLGDHPVGAYLEAGIRVTLATDNWLISDVALSGEYELAQRDLGLSNAQIDRLILNGFEAGFAPAAIKAQLLQQAREALAET